MDYIIAGLILLGAIILWFAATNTRKIFDILPENKFRENWTKIRLFMLVFIAGYLIVVGLILFGKTELLALLSGVIFLFGALFVYLVVFTGYDSFKKLDELNKNIDKTKLINKELERFAYVTSHDLKAPLRAISTLSSFIKEDLASGQTDDVNEHIDTLQGRVKRLEKLIDGILKYSKVGEITSKLIDLNAIILSEIDNYQKSENVNLTIKGKLPIVYGDQIQLAQVMANVINNAVKYNDKEVCEVSISSVENEVYHEITIEDNGPGIAPEYHLKVFDVFQTLNARDEVESTGIGLSIVKRIIDTHRGTIRIESDGISGTKFIISLLKTATKQI